MKKHIYFILLMLMLPITKAFSEDSVAMTVSRLSDTEWQLEFQLENPDTKFTGFQMDMLLPEGTSIKESTLLASERLYQVLVQANTMPSGWIRVVGYSSTRLANIRNTTGNLYTYVIQSAEPLPEGEYSVKAKNVRFTTSKSEETVFPALSTTFIVKDIMSYNLSFMNDDELYYSTMVEAGANIPVIDDPEAKKGHTFSGWSEMPEVMPDSDLVLHAIWTPIEYTLTYTSADSVVYTEQVAYNTPITPYTPEDREGYSFGGWSDMPEVMPDSNVVVSAIWTPIEYTVTYISGDSIVHTEQVAYGSSIPVYNPEEVTGYSFIGWINMPDSMPAQDIEVIAEWKANTYTISYYIDEELVYSEEVEYNAPVTLYEYNVSEPRKYRFGGWTGEKYETMPAQDITYYGELLLIGDVNRDKTINSTDIVSIYNYILLGSDSSVSFEYANVNNDSAVNSADVVAVYNIIIGGTTQP